MGECGEHHRFFIFIFYFLFLQPVTASNKGRRVIAGIIGCSFSIVSASGRGGDGHVDQHMPMKEWADEMVNEVVVRSPGWSPSASPTVKERGDHQVHHRLSLQMVNEGGGHLADHSLSFKWWMKGVITRLITVCLSKWWTKGVVTSIISICLFKWWMRGDHQDNNNLSHQMVNEGWSPGWSLSVQMITEGMVTRLITVCFSKLAKERGDHQVDYRQSLQMVN